MMKILIIGCGYVGKRIAKKWLDEGEHVTVTTRNPDRVQELKAVSTDVLLLTEDNLSSLMQDKDLVLVAVAPGKGGDYEKTYLKTAEKIKACPRPKQLIVISSTSVYGDHNGERVTEDSPLHPTNDKQRILIRTEKTYLSLNDCQVCIFRLGEIVGPGRDPAERLKKLNGGALPGNGENFTNLSPIDLILEALDKAKKKRFEGIYNLTSPLKIPRREYYRKICEEKNIPLPAWDPSQTSIHGGNKRVDPSRYFEKAEPPPTFSKVVGSAAFFIRSIFKEPLSTLSFIPYELIRFWKPVNHFKIEHSMRENEMPVHFIHGFCAFAGLWRTMQARFLKEGFHCLTAKTRYCFNSIEEQADNEWIKIQQVLKKTGKNRVDLVAHSEGGLVALTLARKHPEQVRSVACIGSPVQGTDHANVSHRLLKGVGLGSCAEEMSSRSRFIEDLNAWLATKAGQSPTRFLFIHSTIDQIILPPEHSRPSVQQDNFTFLPIHDLLHIQMHFHPKISQALVEWARENS